MWTRGLSLSMHQRSRRDKWADVNGNIPVLATFGVFIFVSIAFVIYGVIQRRRFARQLADSGLPPEWRGLNWAGLRPRLRETIKTLGPRPELLDVQITQWPTQLDDWHGILPLTLRFGLDSSRSQPSSRAPSITVNPAGHTTWRDRLPFRLPGLSRRNDAVHVDATNFFTGPSGGPGASVEKQTSSKIQLPESPLRMADVAVFIAMPMPLGKDSIMADLHEFAGLTLGITPTHAPRHM